jgi:hypothetical protein
VSSPRLPRLYPETPSRLKTPSLTSLTPTTQTNDAAYQKANLHDRLDAVILRKDVMEEQEATSILASPYQQAYKAGQSRKRSKHALCEIHDHKFPACINRLVRDACLKHTDTRTGLQRFFGRKRIQTSPMFFKS